MICKMLKAHNDMNTKFILICLLSATFLINSSCKKQAGCTDPDSITYNSEADEDDGSCTYEGYYLFYFDKNTSDAMIANSSDSLLIYIEGTLLLRISTMQYSNTIPDYTSSYALGGTHNLGFLKSNTVNYRVVSEDGVEYWNSSMNIEAKKTEVVKLQFTK